MAHAASVGLSDIPFHPDLVVISPDDPDAMCRRVRECQDLDIPYLYDPSQQIVRLDREDTKAISNEMADKVIVAFKKAVKDVDLVIISDYAKGLLSDKIIKAFLENSDSVPMVTLRLFGRP